MTETTLPNLFWEPDAEVLYDDPDEILSWAIDDRDFNAEHGDPPIADRVVRIEEWAAVPITKSLPSAEGVVELLCERYAEELDEDACEAFSKGGKHPDVIAAFEAALALWREKCLTKYRMADRLLRTHVYIIPPSGDYYLQSTEER